MAKAKNDTAVLDETAAVNQEEVVSVVVVETAKAFEVVLVVPGTFISEEGNGYEFNSGAFVFKGKKYDAVEAVANAPEVLEELVKLNSFILKQK